MADIIGNQNQKKGSATEERAANKKEKDVNYSRLIIAGAAISAAVSLSLIGLSFFQKLLVAIVLITVGGKLAKIKTGKEWIWHWPALAKTTGWAFLAITLLLSGFGQWTNSAFSNVDEYLTCAADKNKTNEKCTAKREREAEAKRLEREAKAQARAKQYKPPPETHPAGAPTSVVVPSCQSGQVAMVAMPKGWTIHLAWNQKAADYWWRSVNTGEWVRSPEGGADAVKFCALHEAYAGDTMAIGWSRS